MLTSTQKRRYAVTADSIQSVVGGLLVHQIDEDDMTPVQRKRAQKMMYCLQEARSIASDIANSN